MLSSPLLPYYPPQRLVAFAGWQMPVFFEGVLKEHHAVRQGVGLFDISHMGKFDLTCPLTELEQIVPSLLGKLPVKQAQYTLLLNEQGGIIDDVIFYYQGGEQWRVIVNAATKAKDFAWMQQHLPHAHLTDISAEHTLLALQGPQAVATLQLLCDRCISSIPRFGHAEVILLGQPAWLARTGYTGEDGFEIMTTIDAGIALWQALLEQGVIPCGLGARDSLRLEAAMHLYGQDMDETTTPLEANLGWVIHPDKTSFIGKAALTPPTRKLVGIMMLERGIARHDYPILVEGKEVGKITSGGPSPTLGKNIALGYVPTEFAKVGTPLQVQIRNQPVAAVVVKRPFYKRP